MIETARLRLLVNNPQHILALIESVEQFEALSGLRAAEGLRDFLVSDEVSPWWVARLKASTVPDPWLHGFAVVDQQSGLVIGNAGFTDAPDDQGMVEIGYGIVPSFEGRGFATEAAEALIAFALGDERVRTVQAHTLPVANASTRILTKCGFRHIGEVVTRDDGVVWRWELIREPVRNG
jgi:RimJ/RimL family protein N-acetyltransferase